MRARRLKVLLAGCLASFLTAGLAAMAAGCREAPPPAVRPHVVVISIDTLRADHLGCYGYRRDTSPRLDAFAAGGVLFTEACSPTAWTLPGHASMLTGLSPVRSTLWQGEMHVAQDARLLAEILRDEGYRTGAVVNGFFVKERFGFDRGFERFDFVKNGREEWPLHDAATRELVAWASPEEPCFLFVHFMSVHSPYDPPEEFMGFVRPYAGPLAQVVRESNDELRAVYDGELAIDPADRDYLVDLYDGVIAATDARVGALLDAIDARLGLENTLVVITSDHGEEFLDHGSVLHTSTLYDELLRVPLILRGPGVPAGVRSPALAALTDVVPTLLDLIGLQAPDGLDGLSLVPCFRDDAVRPGPWIELLTHDHKQKTSKRGLRTPTAKLVLDLLAGSVHYYDLESDPDETRDLHPNPASQALLDALLELPRPEFGSTLDLDAAEEQSLRQLGYLK